LIIIRYLLIFLTPISLFAKLEINSTLYSDTECYKVVGKVSHGSFGSIFELVNFQGEHYILKSYFESVFYRESERSYQLREKIDHPNILKVVDLIRDDDDQNYCVYEFIQGITLEEIHILTREETLYICQQWIDALRFAFSNQLMYIDLNESNIMIDRSNHVTIIDIDSFFYIDKAHYHPSIYFDKGITEMCLTLIRKTKLERAKKIQMQVQIKKLAWEYMEDTKDGKEDIFEEYMMLLLDTLNFNLSLDYASNFEMKT